MIADLVGLLQKPLQELARMCDGGESEWMRSVEEFGKALLGRGVRGWLMTVHRLWIGQAWTLLVWFVTERES